MSMLTLFESRYTLKGRYSIGNVGKTASGLLRVGLYICLQTVLSLNQDKQFIKQPTCESLSSHCVQNSENAFRLFGINYNMELVLFPKFTPGKFHITILIVFLLLNNSIDYIGIKC